VPGAHDVLALGVAAADQGADGLGLGGRRRDRRELAAAQEDRQPAGIEAVGLAVVAGEDRDAARGGDDAVDAQVREEAVEAEAEAAGLVDGVDRAAAPEAADQGADLAGLVGQDPGRLGLVAVLGEDGDGEGIQVGVDAHEEGGGRMAHGPVSRLRS